MAGRVKKTPHLPPLEHFLSGRKSTVAFPAIVSFLGILLNTHRQRHGHPDAPRLVLRHRHLLPSLRHNQRNRLHHIVAPCMYIFLDLDLVGLAQHRSSSSGEIKSRVYDLRQCHRLQSNGSGLREPAPGLQPERPACLPSTWGNADLLGPHK